MKKILLISLLFFSAIYVQGQNKLESSINEYYDGAVWYMETGVNYEYDANNNLITETHFYWDETNWVANGKIIYTYNAGNKTLTRTLQSDAATPGQFTDYAKTIYTYNDAGKLITLLDQYIDTGTWVNSSKAEITYNGDLLATVARPYWNGAQWVDDERGLPTYTGTNLTQILNQWWNSAFSEWHDVNRNILTYNASNKITNDSYEELTNFVVWEPVDNTSYVYAANGNRTSEIFSSSGDIEYKDDYYYDATAQMSSFAHPFKDKTGVDYVNESFPYVNKILNYTTSYYDAASLTYELTYKTTYNYQSQLLSKENFELNKIMLYPNPANTVVNIQMEQQIEAISVVDISGRTTAIKPLSQTSFDVSNLANGVYFIEIKTAEGVFREKFIKN